MRNACTVMLLGTALISAVMQAQFAPATALFEGRLYAAALHGDPKRLTPADVNRVAPHLRSRMRNFVRCLSMFRSRLRKPQGFFAEAAFAKQRNVERGIACVIQAPGIGELAADYAANARILYEWEGLSSSPLEESEFAEKYIHEHPQSPLKPYLYLFIAQRARYAFEFLARQNDPTAMSAVARQYRSFMTQARQADPFTALIADDLDALPYVYEDVGKHPTLIPN